MRRLKNYMRLKLTRLMTQERLNHVAVHHVHKTRVDALDINKIKQCLYTPVNIGVAYLDSSTLTYSCCKLTLKHDCMDVAARNCLGDRQIIIVVSSSQIK